MMHVIHVTPGEKALQKAIAALPDAVKLAAEKNEPYVVARAAMEICTAYNKFYFEVKLPNTAKDGSAQLLDIFDYLSNNILMPIVAIGTCILIGWIVKPKTIIDEATKNGEKLGRKAMYPVMIKFIAPVLLFILFLGSLGLFN